MSNALDKFSYNLYLQENNLGPYGKILNSFSAKTTLCPDIFEKGEYDYVMREDVLKKLLEIAQEFVDWLGLDVTVQDVTLTGSLANFNWSEFSDVDLHIIIDFSKFKEDQDLVKNFFDAKKNVWNNEHNIKIKGFDTELYVQDSAEKHTSTGVYSLKNNRWVVEPEYESKEIDKELVMRKAQMLTKKINELINRFNEGQDVTSEVEALKKKIKNFRQAGLDRAGEYSYENLAFKLLRRTGYIEKLFILGNTLADRKLSLDELMNW